MIHIWTRRTVDWSDERAFEAQLDPAFRPRVELWNATFSLPFHRFRHEVREIARANHAAVHGATCSAWDDIPDGALVLPVDDDDWFAPDVADVLAQRPGEGHRWTSSFLEVPRDLEHALSRAVRGLLPGVGPKWACTTNNYALVKRPGHEPLLRSHVKASRWLEEDPARMGFVDRRLSLMNRTLASRTSLEGHRRPVGRRALLRKHARYRALYRRPPAPGLAWAQPYADRMAALMDRLEIVA